MILYIKYISSVILIALGVVSCAPKTIGETLIKVERRKTNELIEKLDSISKQIPHTFYAKISTQYKDTTKEVSFKTSVKIVKDSAMTALVTYASIPLVNAIITKDSLQFTNKREKCYVKSTLTHLKEQFGVDFDFTNVQQLFLGLPLNYQTSEKHYQIHDVHNYILSNYKKRGIKKLERKNLDDFIIKYYLTNDLKGLKKITIENPGDTTNIEIKYADFKMENGYNIPTLINVQIKTQKNNILVQLEYDKLEINEPQEIFFTIPENYEQCN
jgi:hypothetical protein